MDRTRILIVANSEQYRAKLSRALDRSLNHVESSDQAATPEEALALVAGAAPDIVVLEVGSPGLDGLQLTRLVKQQHPTTSVILMTWNYDEEELFHAMRNGAAAYLPRSATGKELAATVARVREGSYVIDDDVLASPALASRVLTAFRELAGLDQRVKPLFAPLSPREIEVLEQAARGSSNKQIGRTMGISEQTVKNHLTSIMRKLAVNDRTHAVVFALQHGWISVPDA